jgi:hypothetical protein
VEGWAPALDAPTAISSKTLSRISRARLIAVFLLVGIAPIRNTAPVEAGNGIGRSLATGRHYLD